MSDTDLVRLLINDPAGATQTLSDLALGNLLTMEVGSVKLAAAQALDLIASNEALVSKRITALDLQTDGPAVAVALRAHAAALRAQVLLQLSGDIETTSYLGTPNWLNRPELQEPAAQPYYGGHL